MDLMRLHSVVSLLLFITFNTPTTLSFSLNNNNNNINTNKPEAAFTGVRFSLYPNVGKENPPSLKQAVKTAVKGLDQLGLHIQPDDVSSCLLGPEPALFEAVRSCFARASVTTGGGNDSDDDDGTSSNKKYRYARSLSMQCTFSAGCRPGEEEDYPLEEFPVRTAIAAEGKEFIEDAYLQPPRIAAQFAIYPMGCCSSSTQQQQQQQHSCIDTVHNKVIDNAKQSSVWKEGGKKIHFCNMLDGDGNEVFDVLRQSFALARECTDGHVVMTATLTANKSAWPEEDRSQPR